MRYLPILLLFFLTIPAWVSLAKPGFFPMQDDLQAFRLHQMDKCFKDWQIPCRWVPDAGYQYGYPQFNYYSPSVYYLGEVIHLLGFQFIDTVKILFVLGFVLAAFFMFLFLRTLLGMWPAVVGVLLYTYTPYKAVDVYVRGSLSEFWAFVFFPVIFWSSYQLIKLGNLKYLVWLSLSIGLLLTTHNLMSMIFLPVAAVWILALVIIHHRWRIFPRLMLSGLLGVGLAAFFTLPVVFESKYAHLESMLGGYFDWRQHFVNLEQLFFSNFWGYGSSILGPWDEMSLSTGPIHWLAGVVAVVLAVANFRKHRKLAVLTLILAGLSIGVLFLTHQKSTFIWEKVWLLTWLQFPWRFLADSVFLLSLLGAIAVFLAGKKEFSAGLGVSMILGILVLHAGFFQPQSWFDLSDREKFSGESWEKQLTVSIFDYLPIFATLPPTQKAPSLPEVLEGQAEFISYQKGSNYQIGEVMASAPSLLRLPLFDFPGMRVTVDGKTVPHWHDDCRDQKFCLGLITFQLTQGRHIIKAQLNNTPIRTMGNTVTIISGLILVWLRVKSYKDEKNFS